VLSENRVDRWTGIAVVLVLILGCVLVLRPFLSSILWSVILAFSTWPIYRRITSAMAGRRSLASGVMVFAVTAVLIVPLGLIGSGLEQDVTSLVEMTQQLLSEGPSAPPGWVARLPIVGTWVHDRWQETVGSGAKLTAALLKVLAPLRDWALRSAANLGESLGSMRFRSNGSRRPRASSRSAFRRSTRPSAAHSSSR
jgi:predicted PurR-regulated permease PerM